jgi:hypothetical protein
MATKTVGTPATTSLTGVQYSPDPAAMANADMATIALGITRDAGSVGFTGGPLGSGVANGDPGGNKVGVTATSILPGAFNRRGEVYLPGGRCDAPMDAQPGDWVCNDAFGNIFLIPQRALPKTLTLANCTTVNASPALVFPSSIWALGWQPGTHVTGTNIPAGCVLGDISGNGLAANLYTFSTGLKANATGSASNVTITAGTFTHS